MKDAVGIGALNLDLIYSVKDLKIRDRKFAPGGEIFGSAEEFSDVVRRLKKRGKLMNKCGGGSAANCMYALGNMGYNVGFIGMIGDDEHRDFILTSMGKVDTSRVKRFDGTGLAISMVAHEDRSLLILPNSNDWFYVNEDDIKYANDSRIVHITSFVAANGLETQKKIAASLDKDVILSFDPGELYAKRGLTPLKSLVERANIVFVSEREVAMLTGLDHIGGSRRLLEMGPETVVCKMGEKGSMVFTKNEEISIDVWPAKVVDKTGAGDVYDAGFLAGILGNWPLGASGEFASYAAAKSISHYGREGYPDKTTLMEYEED
ncbi:MAG: PfkB family carbohydrate kinase [Methanomassiliicoccales archaeon]|jgi:ribokinase